MQKITSVPGPTPVPKVQAGIITSASMHRYLLERVRVRVGVLQVKTAPKYRSKRQCRATNLPMHPIFPCALLMNDVDVQSDFFLLHTMNTEEPMKHEENNSEPPTVYYILTKKPLNDPQHRGSVHGRVCDCCHTTTRNQIRETKRNKPPTMRVV